MVSLSTIMPAEKSACIAFSIELAKTAISTERGYVTPTARVGMLSDFEWEKIVMGAVSGWVAERARQVGERFLDEEFLLSTALVPEPYQLGIAALALPRIGDLVDRLGLADRAIGEWSRDEVCRFVCVASEILARVRAGNENRPDAADAEPVDTLMAG